MWSFFSLIIFAFFRYFNFFGDRFNDSFRFIMSLGISSDFLHLSYKGRIAFTQKLSDLFWRIELEKINRDVMGRFSNRPSCVSFVFDLWYSCFHFLTGNSRKLLCIFFTNIFGIGKISHKTISFAQKQQCLTCGNSAKKWETDYLIWNCGIRNPMLYFPCKQEMITKGRFLLW